MSTRIQIITLEPQSSNVRVLTAALAAEGLEASCFPAIDGRQQAPALEAGEYLDEAAALRYRRTLLTRSEIGCYLSHLRAVRQAFEEGVERLCLLEDDVALEAGFGDVFRGLQDLTDQRYEFVRLMALKHRRRKPAKTLPANRMLTRPFKGLCGTQGYVVNRNGMRKILEHGTRIWRPIDKFYDHFWDTGLACYLVEPHIIFELPSPSSISKSTTQHPAASPLQGLQKTGLKLWRSWRLRLHRWQRFAEFYPHTRTRGAYGRTERIR
ncbi:MAG: glycosyltransferase family 25 protein [Pseudomonadota bacterium]